MKKHAAAIITSGCLWGFMGLFRRYMGEMGISSAGIIILRCGASAVFFAITMLLTGPGQFRVKLRDLWCFIGSGICSLLFFTYCYFQAMTLMSLSAAAILLYTAPSMVMIMSLFIFGEKLTIGKVISAILAFLGCAFVSGLGGGGITLTPTGILYGLGSGFGYALYSIFARLALDRGYKSNTVNFYSCLLAAVGAAVIWGGAEPVSIMFSSWGNAGLCLLAAVVTSYLPYLLYTYGLTGLETGKASIMASVEPVVATFVGLLVFREQMTIQAAAGVLLVLAAVVILNMKKKNKALNN
ncbi:MAG: EamA family transporter [Clostridia bacterium]|nr:EamA family transporter [Clostridia bacterium]